MAAEFFDTLLEEIGKIMKLKLEPDANNSCLIKLPTGISIQLEMDRYGENLIMGAELGELPPGKFREDIFKVALAGNYAPAPRHGILAFSRQTNNLVLFHQMPIQNLQATDVNEYLAPFSEKARGWKEAIANGVVPEISLRKGGSEGMSGIFGLQP